MVAPWYIRYTERNWARTICIYTYRVYFAVAPRRTFIYGRKLQYFAPLPINHCCCCWSGNLNRRRLIRYNTYVFIVRSDLRGRARANDSLYATGRRLQFPARVRITIIIIRARYYRRGPWENRVNWHVDENRRQRRLFFRIRVIRRTYYTRVEREQTTCTRYTRAIKFDKKRIEKYARA